MLSPTTEALTTGLMRIPCISALAMKGMNVSFTPCRSSQPLRTFSRSLTMCVISTLKMVWTWALVRRDSTMRSAIFLRIAVIGTSLPGSSVNEGAAGVAGRGTAGAAGDVAGFTAGGGAATEAVTAGGAVTVLAAEPG